MPETLSCAESTGVPRSRRKRKRQAQQRLVQTILSDENDGLAPVIQGRSDVAIA